MDSLYILKKNSSHDEDENNPDEANVSQYHEELLCTMKLYNRGILEVTPGFSNIESEDSDDDDIFVNNEALEISANKGSKLTTFTFSTPSGSIFQYSLEWLDYLLDEDVAESLALTVSDGQYTMQSTRRRKLVSQIAPHTSLFAASEEELFMIDFDSVSEFKPMWKRSSIRIDYEILLPQGWKYELISSDMRRSTRIGSSITGSTGLVEASRPATKANGNLENVVFLLSSFFFIHLVSKDQ